LRSTSGYKNAYQNKNTKRDGALILKNGKLKHLGMLDDSDDTGPCARQKRSERNGNSLQP